jgi:hypothetical protein
MCNSSNIASDLIIGFAIGLVSGSLAAWVAVHFQTFLNIKMNAEVCIRCFPGNLTNPAEQRPEACIAELHICMHRLEDAHHEKAASIINKIIDDIKKKVDDRSIYKPPSDLAPGNWVRLNEDKTNWKKEIWKMNPNIWRLFVPKSKDNYEGT